MPKLLTYKEGIKTISLTFNNNNKGLTLDVITSNISIVKKPYK